MKDANKLVCLGIDPGTPKSRVGLCVWDGDKILEITTINGEKIYEKLLDYKRDGIIDVVGVEVSTSTHIYSRPGVSPRGMLKIAQNVSANRCAALQIIIYIQNLGLEVVQVEPKNTKMDPLLFQKITGYTKRCSSHARDAWGIARRTYAEVYFKSRIKE